MLFRSALPVDELERWWSGASGRGRANGRGRDGESSESDGGAPWDPDAAPSGAGDPGGHGGRGHAEKWTPRRDGRFKGKFAARDREAAEREALLRLPRAAPKKPEDRAVQMLFGQPGFWEQLSMDEHACLHALPAPHGPLVGWLERDLSEHGPRPWAVLSHALKEDPALDAEALRIADGDADPDATFADFRRAVDAILDRQLKAETQRLIALSATDPSALARYGEVFRHWQEVNTRLKTVLPEE